MKSFDSVVYNLCEEIEYLKEELALARKEAKHYKSEYNEMLSSSINHSHKMMGNLLDVLVTDGVCEKFMNKKP